jgi:hypothetical protein
LKIEDRIFHGGIVQKKTVEEGVSASVIFAVAVLLILFQNEKSLSAVESSVF